MISVASGFQYSVNIGYDFGDDTKLRNFIPTKSSLSLLEDILMSVNPSSSDRARVLIGAYGKGKSHIVLMILSILMKRDLSLFEKLLPKIDNNPKLAQLINNYYDSDNKILPVVISGSNISLTQAFLISLHRTLSEYNLLDIMPDTNYKAAANVITRWEKDFPDTFSAFQEIIDDPIDVFIDRLENYDINAYETFEQIYPTLTAGSVFNPFLGFDVVDLYESVAKSLQVKGYSGIYVIYDEFSKFLEANINDASLSDIKMLQDFAEKCCRSESLQMHIMLISHKEISNYIDKLPKEKTDGWRGVSERFKHVHMNNNFTQTYEIISSVIKHKEPLWDDFQHKHQNDFDALIKRYQSHQMFKDAKDEIGTAVIGCFPLHPVSTFILPRLSERVAQNERTLFTFLSSTGTSTLSSFLENYNNDFSLVTPDLIYDYFEPLFKKELYDGEIHRIFVLTSTILNQLHEKILEAKIVKTISLIYILEQFERLVPTKEQIIGIYSVSYEVDEIERAITDLIDKEFVVYIKRSNDFLQLKQTSGVDIQKKIHDLLESQAGKVSARDILNESNFDNYIYPSRYNEEHEMTRFFSFQFISGDEVREDVDWKLKSISNDSDGIIYGIIPESETQLHDIETKISEISKVSDLCIFALPKHFKDMNKVIYEYAAVNQLRDEASDDPILFDEYEVVFEDLQEIINSYIREYTYPQTYQTTYYYDGMRLNIHRKSNLTEIMSKICDAVYGLTPVINNESVNKNEITNVAKNSRNKIVGALLRSELEPNLGFTGTGQEVSIMRSTIVRTGVLFEENGVLEINLSPANDEIRNMLGTIEGFILDSRQNGKTSFSVLYNKLTSPEFHIGLRNGVIPIYIAAVMHKYRQQVIINDNFGPVPTTADVLIQINSDPSSYSLEYLDWNPEKENYINQLSDAFSDYIINSDMKGNSYDYVANAIRRWYMALPKYSRECKSTPSGKIISNRMKEMMKALRISTTGSDLLFKKLPKAFAYDEFSIDVAEDIINAKKTYDGLLDDLKHYLISETKKIFTPEIDQRTRDKTSLTAIVIEWRESLDPKSFEQLFPDGTDQFLKHLASVTNDEDLFITRLAKLATGLRLEDWDENTPNTYFMALQRYMTTAKAFHDDKLAETINDTSSYQLTFADEEGHNMVRRFDKVDISPRGKLLFNQITASLDAMGHSISEQEKRQVLMEALKKLC